MQSFSSHVHNHQGGFSVLAFIAVILSILTVFITTAAIAFYQIRANSLTEEILAQQDRRAENLATRLESYAIGARQLAESVAQLITPLRNDKTQVEQLIQRLLQSAPPRAVYGIGVWFEPYQFKADEKFFGPYTHWDGHGKPMLTYEWSTPEYNYPQQYWYQTGKNGRGEIRFTEPYFDTDMVYMSVVKAIYATDGTFLGTITVDMVLPLMRKLIAEANVSPNELIFVSTAKDAIFVHPEEQQILHYARQHGMQPTSILDLYLNDLDNYNAVIHTSETFQHTKQKVDYVHWQIHIVSKKSVLFKAVGELRRDVTYSLTGLWILLLVLLLLLARLSLNNQRAKQERERLEREVHERKEAAATLQNLNDELEQRVKARTAELQKANAEIQQLNIMLSAENQRMGAELDVTRQLQQMVLPRKQELKACKELDIAGLMLPATEVGGDYYDVLQYGDRIKIGIGDVTGHGLASGVLMMMVQTAVRTLLASNVTDATTFMTILNRVVYDNVCRMGTDKNLTLTLLDYHAGMLRITGQHEDVLVVRANGYVERIDTLDLGFMVGLQPDIEHLVASIDVELVPGDGVVLYTDGITEAFNPKNNMYGVERLCTVISRHWHLDVEQIQQSVLQDVQMFMGSEQQMDDLTLLVLKRTGVEEKEATKRDNTAHVMPFAA